MKIYILAHLDSLLDYSELRVYTDKQEAIEDFNRLVTQAKQEANEIYDQYDYCFYFDNGESGSKIFIEEHTIQ